MLSYSVEERLRPFFDYLASVGIVEAAAVVAKRPTLLGLDADQNLKKMVGYLLESGNSVEEIVKYLETSL